MSETQMRELAERLGRERLERLEECAKRLIDQGYAKGSLELVSVLDEKVEWVVARIPGWDWEKCPRVGVKLWTGEADQPFEVGPFRGEPVVMVALARFGVSILDLSFPNDGVQPPTSGAGGE